MRSAFGNAVMVADAKAWAISLDRKATIDAKREYPPEQIEWYLNNSQLDYAILTNGRLWRLVPRQHDPGQARFQNLRAGVILKKQPPRTGIHRQQGSRQ